MIPEEIRNLLIKYQDNNIKEINEINKSISTIMNQLAIIKDNLCDEISSLYKNNIIDERNTNLNTDITSLITYINNIESLQIPAMESFTQSSIFDCEIIDNQMELNAQFNNTVRPFLVSKNYCPECNSDLEALSYIIVENLVMK